LGRYRNGYGFWPFVGYAGDANGAGHVAQFGV
jgi:hypothetical protein